MNTFVEDAPTHIVVDWGTSRLRATLVDDSGKTFGTIESDQGIQYVAKNTHAQTLRDVLTPWLQEFELMHIYASGMISSRNGWLEIPYVPCPAGVAQISAAIHTIVLDDGLTIHIVPGITDVSVLPFPDVMRGEETQILGAVEKDGHVVLPGTHSKWATVTNGAISAFRTVVTGELYDVMRKYSFIAKGTDQHSLNEAVFRQGIATALQAPADLQSHLFGARTGVLAGTLASDTTGDYLSGLLIAHEYLSSDSHSEPLVIVGNTSLTKRYLVAADELGIKAETGPSDAGLRGIQRLRNQQNSFASR